MAAALYAPEPDTSELAAFGLTVEDFEDEAVQIWPDTAAALALFSRLGTQWRIGMGGATGLDYTATLALLARQRLPQDEEDALFDDIRVMESAALAAMRTKP